MPVTLNINGSTTAAVDGLSLFEHAERLGVRVPTSCHKNGKCKECMVEVNAGMECLTPRTEEEAHLPPNFRLSCRSRIAAAAAPDEWDSANNALTILLSCPEFQRR